MEMRFKSSHRVSSVLYMALAMVMWAVIESIARLFSQHYTSFQIVWMRYSVHLLFMLVVFGPRVKMRLVRTKRLGLQIVRGMLMMGMHVSFILAIRSISGTTTMTGFWIAPLLMLLLSTWYGERAGRLQLLITLAGYGCVLIMSRPLGGLLHPAALLSIIMAVCFVLYMQMTRAMPGEDLLASLFYTALSVWVVLSALMPFYWVAPNWHDMLIFAAIGLIGFVGILGFDKAAELAPTWVSAPVGFIQPVLVLLIDWLTRNIFPGRLSLIAAALILAFVIFLLRRTPNQPASPGYQHA